jgi:Leucine-rich repeat (LRR) protein
MRLPKEPINRTRLVRGARHLLDWLGWIYIDHVLGLEAGHKPSGALPDHFYEDSYDTWAELLREAPSALLKPDVLRLIVEVAIAESQLRTAERFERRVGRARVVEILSEFGRAVNPERFASTQGQRFRAWLAGAMTMPAPPATGLTPDDLRLRAKVDSLTDDQRLAYADAYVDSAKTLRDLTPLCALPALRKLNIPSAPLLVDLSPLTRLTELRDLELSAPTLRDLWPLARMPGLRRLCLDAEEGLDLSPLRALTGLEELRISGCDDLSALEGLPALTDLAISARHGAPDLEPIWKLAGLRRLSLYDMKLESTDFVRALPSLVSLTLGSCEPLTDVSALARLADLEELDLSHCPVRDVSSLKLPKLRVLDLEATAIRSWPPLRDLPRLEALNVKFTALTSFAGVEVGLSLRTLEVGFSEGPGLADLAPLAKLTRLETLQLEELPQVADLSPLGALTALRVLAVIDTAARDLSPLASLAALENVVLTDSPFESVEALAGLPKLRLVTLARCTALRSIRPLARCPALERVDCEDCDALTGPTSLEQLRAPPPAEAKRFPSAGAAVNRPGAAVVVDVRGHLPKRPPEGWSLPERDHGDLGVYWLEAEHDTMVLVMLWSKDDQHLLMIQLWRRDGSDMTDKQAARILRRFRASDPFIENDDMIVGDVKHARCFMALAHAASPDTWGAWRTKNPLIRVEANDDASAWASADVRNHLPSPLPAGWSIRPTREPDDVACIVSAPEAEMTVLLSTNAGDAVKLAVSLMPPRGSRATSVGDETARALLARFRGRGAFEESASGPIARAPGMRFFVAPPKGGSAS